MPAATKDTATVAQGRFVVSLPKDVGEQIDIVAQNLAAAFERETGVAFELSRAQVVQALVRQALAGKDEPSENGDAAGV
jgi:hypothetical protein